MRESPLREKSMVFAVQIVKLASALREERREYSLAGRLQNNRRRPFPEMKTQITRHSTLVTRHSSLHGKAVLSSLVTAIAFCAVAQSAIAAAPGVVTPYTFLGRVMDPNHAGFDTNRVCTLAAYNDESGEFLAQTQTFFYPDSRRNYALRVPVSTDKAAGYAVQGEALAIAATDDLGKVWEGVIPGALCGEAAGIREVDIVLGEDKDGNGVDDTLENQLRIRWETGPYWEEGEEFDVTRDYDGDGVGTLNEVYAGTNPFDSNDVLRITSMNVEDVSDPSLVNPHSSRVTLSFPVVSGRAYRVETVSDLASNDWTGAAFVPEGAADAVTTISIPSSNRSPAPPVVYLLPTTNSAAFFRIRLE